MVEEALAQMPPQTREIFIKNRFDGLKYKDIAAETGLSVKSIEFHVSKALKILRLHLKDYFIILLFFSDLQ